MELGIRHIKSDAGIVTISICLTTLKGKEINKSVLHKHSDTALYAAKSEGKNCSYVLTTDTHLKSSGEW